MEQSGSTFKAGGSNGVGGLTANRVKPVRNAQNRQQPQPRRRIRLESWKHPTTRRSGPLSFWDLPATVRMQVYQYFVQPPPPKFLHDGNRERLKIIRTRQSLFELSKDFNREWTPIFYASKATHCFQAWGPLYTPHLLDRYRLTLAYTPIYEAYTSTIKLWLDNLRQMYYEFRTARVGHDAWEFKYTGADHLASFLFRHKPASLREIIMSTEVAPNSHRFYFDVGKMPGTHHVWKDLWTATSDEKKGDGWAMVQRRFQVCAGKNALVDWHVTRRLRYQTEKLYREVDNKVVEIGVTLVVKSVQLLFRKYERAPQAVANRWVEFE